MGWTLFPPARLLCSLVRLVSKLGWTGPPQVGLDCPLAGLIIFPIDGLPVHWLDWSVPGFCSELDWSASGLIALSPGWTDPG
jgi:hypothetical protein